MGRRTTVRPPSAGDRRSREQLLAAVERLVASSDDWTAAGAVGREIGITAQRASTVLAAAAREGALEVIEPDVEHRGRRYRPVAYIPRHPRSSEDWRRSIDASPQLTDEDRQVLRVAVTEDRGAYVTSRERAQRVGLSTAGYFYRLERAYAKLGIGEPRPRRRVSGALRRELVAIAIAERAPCGLCGDAIITETGLAMDHIDRKREGGSDERTNLRVVHWICNAAREHRAVHPTLEEMTVRLYKRALHGSPRGIRVEPDPELMYGEKPLG